jgi:hypothetical protein
MTMDIEEWHGNISILGSNFIGDYYNVVAWVIAKEIMMVLKIQKGLKSYHGVEPSSSVIRKFVESIKNILNITIQNIYIYILKTIQISMSLQTRSIALNRFFEHMTQEVTFYGLIYFACLDFRCENFLYLACRNEFRACNLILLFRWELCVNIFLQTSQE